MSFKHDAEGNVTEVTEDASSSTPKVTEYSYYGDGRLHQVTFVRSGGTPINGYPVFTYTYDPGGRPLTLEYPASTGIVAHFSGPSSEVGWDANGQLLHLRYVKNGSTTLRRFEYSYDPAGNRRTQKDIPNTGDSKLWVFEHDWLASRRRSRRARLVKVSLDTQANPANLANLDEGNAVTQSIYLYDESDNRIEFQVPLLDEVFSYAYDDADNITEVERTVGAGSPVLIASYSSDEDGNLLTRTDELSSVVTSYTWSDFNRLVAISTTDDSKKQTNVFGVNGFRRKKKDKNDEETTEYAAGLATAVAKSQAETFTYLMGHQLLGFEKSDGSMFLFLTDALSTVRNVVDSDGDIVASYEFSEYGQRISSSESGAGSQKTFVGGLSVQDEVADTGLMLMGHRFYEPEVGRFLNRDPIGFAGGLNLFEYGRSNPMTLTDPDGLLPLGYDPTHYEVHNEPGPDTDMSRHKDMRGVVGDALLIATVIAITAKVSSAALLYYGIRTGTPWALEAGTAYYFGTAGTATATGAGAAAVRANGVRNPKVRAAVYNGNEMHYDCMNGGRGYAGSGIGAPIQLQNRFPDTRFRFTPRGAAGADVYYIVSCRLACLDKVFPVFTLGAGGTRDEHRSKWKIAAA